MILYSCIFLVIMDAPLNRRSAESLLVFFKRREYLTIHFLIAHRVTLTLSCWIRCSFTFFRDAPSPYSCRARTMCFGFILILLNPSSCTNHFLQSWQKNFCFLPEALCLNPFLTTFFEPQSSQIPIYITKIINVRTYI